MKSLPNRDSGIVVGSCERFEDGLSKLRRGVPPFLLKYGSDVACGRYVRELLAEPELVMEVTLELLPPLKILNKKLAYNNRAFQDNSTPLSRTARVVSRSTGHSHILTQRTTPSMAEAGLLFWLLWSRSRCRDGRLAKGGSVLAGLVANSPLELAACK